MPDELYYQRQIIKDVKKVCPQAFAMKMSHKFASGIPDLLVKTPKHPIVFIEVKKIEMLPAKGRIKVGTTPLQRKVMDDMMEAGIACQVWVVMEKSYDGTPGPFIVCVHPSAEEVQVFDYTIYQRPKAKTWPIGTMFAKTAV